KSHEFEMFGGRIISSGKSKWPDSVSMKIPTWYAWNIIQSLLSQLKDGDKVCHLAVCGELKVDVPDE
ncbi:MAG: hypothetical protein ACE1ZQ_00880, partial [Ignavibacteriaceae bacterium]